MSDRADIERALADLSTRISWPDDADLVPVVRRRLLETADARSLPGRPFKVAAAALLIIVGILALPAGRQAVADLLGVAGIEISFGSASGFEAPGDLELGEPVSVVEAAEAAPFPLLVASHPRLGAPDDVYLIAEDPIQVTLVWHGNDVLPAAGDGGIALLHTQFRPDGDVIARKEIGATTALEPVTVRGRDGWWIGGAPHIIDVPDLEGPADRTRLRLAANVLMWEEGTVTHRIETTLDLSQALEIAESLHPVGAIP